jgi:hypothetical protein
MLEFAGYMLFVLVMAGCLYYVMNAFETEEREQWSPRSEEPPPSERTDT